MSVIGVRRGTEVFSGWKSVEVSGALEDAARSCKLSIDGVIPVEADMVLAGDRISVLHNGEPVFFGYIDRVEGNETGADSTLSLSGRSATCDAIDCSLPPEVWRGKRFGDLVARWLDPYGLSCVWEAAEAAAEVIPRYRATPGETVFDAIDKLARDRRLLVTDDAFGRLVITRAGLGVDADDELLHGPGGNILAVSWTDDVSQRYSVVEVRGQRALGDVDAVTTGTYTDLRVDRYRRLIVVPERGTGQAEALWRANWEVLTRAGRSMSRTVTVVGWRQTSGRLWQPNALVRLTDRRRGHVGTPLLITAVSYALTAEGELATLTLAPASAYTPAPTREKSARGGRVSGRWSKWDAGGVE